MEYRLGIVGGGNMGHAIARGAVESGILAAGDVLIAEIDPERRETARQLGCGVISDPSGTTGCEQIMLAVKPQMFSDVAMTIGALPRPIVVISIMAGLGSDAIRAAMGEHARVVRVMPNTPCQVGAGATAVALGAGAEPGDETLTLELFSALGRVVAVDEHQMHAVTAVSGSGPAYVFRLAEAMEAAAVELGLDPAIARTLVEQTITGAGQLLVESAQDAAALRKAVTSPGGTTAAALAVMEEADFAQIVRNAIVAARDRGVELDG